MILLIGMALGLGFHRGLTALNSSRPPSTGSSRVFSAAFDSTFG